MNVALPNNWSPRKYQMDVFDAFKSGIRRGFLLWHRRSGKDDFSLHYTACQAAQRIGNYWHMLPQSNQCRRAIWDAVNPRTGKRRIDEAFPESIRSFTRSQDMMIGFINGSTWQLLGSDNFDSLVGSPPIGLIFSEYALADPRAWAYLRPILADNGGYALMITTPRGKNHAYNLYNHALDDPSWFASKITAEDSGLFTKEQLDSERQELISEFGEEEGYALFMQEYYCSFDGAISGAYYGSLMETAESEKRITNVPYDPALPVTTSWDLGVGDATAIWFWQRTGTEIRAIDYLEASGEGLQYYVKELQSKPYTYDNHIMPHDVRVRELGSGKSRYETALALGIKPITIARKLSIDDGIQAVRSILPKVWFDKKKCVRGIEALRAYRKEYDDVNKCYKNKPLHDWTSHSCDAVRMFAVEGDRPKTVARPVTNEYQQYLRGGSFI